MGPGYDADTIQQWFVAGQRKWPSVSVPFDVFAEHCRGALKLDEPLPSEPADLYLCCACAESQPEALARREQMAAELGQLIKNKVGVSAAVSVRDPGAIERSLRTSTRLVDKRPKTARR